MKGVQDWERDAEGNGGKTSWQRQEGKRSSLAGAEEMWKYLIIPKQYEHCLSHGKYWEVRLKKAKKP